MSLIYAAHHPISKKTTATAAHPMVLLTPYHLHKHHLSQLSLILILVNLELRSGEEVPVILTNLNIIQWDIFQMYK